MSLTCVCQNLSVKLVYRVEMAVLIVVIKNLVAVLTRIIIIY